MAEGYLFRRGCCSGVGTVAMSSLRERIEGLIVRWRSLGKALHLRPTSRGMLCADELAAALAAEGQGTAPADRLREAAEYALDYLVASNQRFNVDPTAIDKLERALAPIDAPWAAAPSLHKEGLPAPFRERVRKWTVACFGEAIADDKVERNHRFLEESLELVQVLGCTRSEANQLVDYVYGRPQGNADQECGGVLVTLAALCNANGIEMELCGEIELSRVWEKIEKIRAKQAAKPRHSPLSEPAALHKEGAGAITVTSAGPNGPFDLPTAEMEEPTDEQESSDEFTVREIIEACAKDLTEFQQLLKRTDGGCGGHGISIAYSKGLLLARNFLSASPAGRAEQADAPKERL